MVKIHTPDRVDSAEACCYTLRNFRANDDEQEEYAHSSPPSEPAAWCEAGASAGAEWAWELRSETQD